jgi:hypothetical protein
MIENFLWLLRVNSLNFLLHQTMIASLRNHISGLEDGKRRHFGIALE